MKKIPILLLIALFVAGAAIRVSAQASASVAMVLVGDGEGMVTEIAPAVAVKPDGVLLIPFHVLKEAKEVQVRLKSGEIYDNASLLGGDERRDIAAIKIQTSELPTAVVADELKDGDDIEIFFHTASIGWGTVAGKLRGGPKMAQDVPGAGEGYKVVQFDAPLPGGIDGGIVFSRDGKLIAIMTADVPAPANSAFAVPVGSTKSLGDNAGSPRSYGSGSALKIPTEAALKAAHNKSTDPKDLLLLSKTVYVTSNTTFFKDQQLINELKKRKEVTEWGWVFVTGGWNERNKADLVIELDHQILSFDFTFSLRHRKTSIIISAGKAVISDGASGAPKMADKIIKSVQDILQPPKGK